MSVVILENLAEKLVLAMVNSFDDVLVISGKVEKASTLSRRPELRENVLSCQRHEVIGWIETEARTQMAEDPRSVVLKLEIVLGRGNEFISGTEGGLAATGKHSDERTHISKVDFCFASKSASVKSRSIFAFVLDTDTRMPVNILYAVTQFACVSSTLVPTSTLSSSSISFLLFLLARFSRYTSAQRKASSSGTISSRGMFECSDCVFLLTKLNEGRRPAAGEKRPLAKPVSTPSREPRGGAGLGTSRVCRCLILWPGGDWSPGDAELEPAGWYNGGDEYR